MMRTRELSLPILLGLALALSVMAKDKPWTQWTEKDAKKILNDSGWGQTQTSVAGAEATWSPTSRQMDGTIDQTTGVNYRIRFLSAKPIRLAFLRLVQLDPKATPEQSEQVHRLVDATYDKVVVIAVSYDQDDLPKDNTIAMTTYQSFFAAITSTLKNNTYLDLKGQRVFLQEYKPPNGDGLGALFIFPRIVNDKPILDTNSGDVRFYAAFPKMGGNDQQIRLNMRFRVADLRYDGILEY